jgi:hypothetical protein
MRVFVLIVIAGLGCGALGCGIGWLIASLSPEFIALVAQSNSRPNRSAWGQRWGWFPVYYSEQSPWRLACWWKRSGYGPFVARRAEKSRRTNHSTRAATLIMAHRALAFGPGEPAAVYCDSEK